MKKVVAIVLCLMMLLPLAACGAQKQTTSAPVATAQPEAKPAATDASAPAKEPEKVYKFKIGTITAPEHPTTIAMKAFVENIKEKSGGRMQPELFIAEQLGTELTQLENLQTGLQEVMCSSADKFGNLNADYNILGMAFAFESQKHVAAFLDSEIGQSMNQKLIDDYGLRNMPAYFWKMPRCLLCKTPIIHPSDLQGKKIRIPNIPIWEKNFTALGAVPVIISYSDLPMSLLTGVVDVAETTYESIYGMKLHEGGPCISEVDYAFPLELMTVSEAWWKTLPADLQEIFTECAKEAAETYTQTNLDNWEGQKKQIIAEGGSFYEVDRKEWMDAVTNLAKQLNEEKFWATDGLYDKVQALIGTY